MRRKCVVIILSVVICIISAVTISKASAYLAENGSPPEHLVTSVPVSSTETSSTMPVSSAVSSMAVSSKKPVSSQSSNIVSQEQTRVSPWEQKQAMISQLNTFDFKAGAARNMYYNDLTYSDMLRNINDYIGAKVAFHGNVESLKRDQVTSTGLLSCGNPNYDENFVISFSYDGYPNFIEKNSIFIYGVITGTSQYFTDDGESHETFNVDAYFYDAANSTDTCQLTPEEQKYYFGNYMVYDDHEFFPLKIDANSINGHPYRILDINKTPDSIFIQFEFTEWPEEYRGKILNGIGDNGVDSILIDLNGDLGTDIHVPSNENLSNYGQGKGWNTKYGKPVWVTRKEQELKQEQDELQAAG